MMFKNALHRLYYLSGGAFLLALLKYMFTENISFHPRYFVIEFLSFVLILVIIYLFDRYIRMSKKQTEELKENHESVVRNLNNKIQEQEKEIVELKNEREQLLQSNEEVKKMSKNLSTSLANINSIEEKAESILQTVAKEYEIGLGVCYIYDEPSGVFSVKATYGINKAFSPKDFKKGEGLNGQVVIDKTIKVIEDIDEDYFNIESCLGESKPKHIYLLPINKNDKCIGLVELATFATVYFDSYWNKLNDSIAKEMSK